MARKRFSPRKPFNKTNIDKIPEDNPINYNLLNRSGDLIYTGYSKRGQGGDRLKDHLSGGSDLIPGARNFQIKQQPSIDRARAEEKKIIRKEKPRYNKKA